MNNGINLSPYKQNTKNPYQKPLRIVRFIAVSLLLITVLLASSFFVLNVTSQEPVLQQQQSTIMTSLNSLQQKAVKIQLLHDRTLLVSNILRQRNSYDTLMTHISGMLGKDITVTRVTVSKKNVILTLSSSSLSSLNDFIQAFATMTDKDKFQKLTVNEITADNQTGLFSLSIQADTL